MGVKNGGEEDSKEEDRVNAHVEGHERTAKGQRKWEGSSIFLGRPGVFAITAG